MENCIFCKIVKKEVPADIVYEDEQIMVFPDIHPKKPIHLLVIPKKHIKEFNSVDDVSLFSKLGQIIQRMIGERGLQNKGYKIEINGGGAQEVDHLHIHLLGPMGFAARD